MMGIETIKEMNREAAAEAAQDMRIPFVYANADEVNAGVGFPFPFIGDYEPEGWAEVDRHFVDSSGMGADDEAALSVTQFLKLIDERIKANPRVGWAVIDVGQFQVYVGEYERDEVTA